jgi:hypothetical protein
MTKKRTNKAKGWSTGQKLALAYVAGALGETLYTSTHDDSESQFAKGTTGMRVLDTVFWPFSLLDRLAARNRTP